MSETGYYKSLICRGGIREIMSIVFLVMLIGMVSIISIKHGFYLLNAVFTEGVSVSRREWNRSSKRFIVFTILVRAGDNRWLILKLR